MGPNGRKITRDTANTHLIVDIYIRTFEALWQTDSPRPTAFLCFSGRKRYTFIQGVHKLTCTISLMNYVTENTKNILSFELQNTELKKL